MYYISHITYYILYIVYVLQLVIGARDRAPIRSCEAINQAEVTVNVYRNQHAPVFINEPYEVNLGVFFTTHLWFSFHCHIDAGIINVKTYFMLLYSIL